MTHKNRDRLRWALATLTCVAATLLCYNFDATVRVTWFIAVLLCPVERAAAAKHKARERARKLAVQLLQKRA